MEWSWDADPEPRPVLAPTMFVQPVSPDLLCGACGHVLDEPVQCRKGHMRCTPCMRKSRWCKRCNADVPEPAYNQYAASHIAAMAMACPCGAWVGDVHAFRQHVAKCERCVACPHCDWKGRSLAAHTCTTKACASCGTLMQAAELKAHTKVCGAVRVPCVYCSENVTRRAMAQHEAECERRPWSCSACGAAATWKEAEAHAPVCPQRVQPCPFCGDELPLAQQPIHRPACPAAPSLTAACLDLGAPSMYGLHSPAGLHAMAQHQPTRLDLSSVPVERLCTVQAVTRGEHLFVSHNPRPHRKLDPETVVVHTCVVDWSAFTHLTKLYLPVNALVELRDDPAQAWFHSRAGEPSPQLNVASLLAALAACRSLRKLEMMCAPVDAHVDALCGMVAAMPHLTHLHVWFSAVEHMEQLAAAAPGLVSFGMCTTLDVPRLAAAWPDLRKLQVLRLQHVIMDPGAGAPADAGSRLWLPAHVHITVMMGVNPATGLSAADHDLLFSWLERAPLVKCTLAGFAPSVTFLQAALRLHVSQELRLYSGESAGRQASHVSCNGCAPAIADALRDMAARAPPTLCLPTLRHGGELELPGVRHLGVVCADSSALLATGLQMLDYSFENADLEALARLLASNPGLQHVVLQGVPCSRDMLTPLVTCDNLTAVTLRGGECGDEALAALAACKGLVVVLLARLAVAPSLAGLQALVQALPKLAMLQAPAVHAPALRAWAMAAAPALTVHDDKDEQ